MKAKTFIGLTAMLAALTVLVVRDWSSGQAQPVASITLPPPGATVQLYPGCNNVGLSFSDGTPSSAVLGAVSPAGSVGAMWRHDAAQQRWEGFSAAAPGASDLLTVNFLDAVWLCLVGSSPTATPIGSPGQSATPTPNAATATAQAGYTATSTPNAATATAQAGYTATPTPNAATATAQAGYTATPTPSGTVSTAVAPTDVLTSFRYSMQVPTQADGMTFTVSSSGDFEAPNVSCAVTLSFFGQQVETQVVVIPPDAWINMGEGWTATTADDPSVLNSLDLCPGSSRFWQGFLPLDVGSIEQHLDPSKGVPAVRVSLKGVVGSLPFFGPIPPEATVNTFDIWVAQSGGWLVALEFDATETADGGGTVQDRMQVGVTNPNDPTITVVRPVP